MSVPREEGSTKIVLPDTETRDGTEEALRKFINPEPWFHTDPKTIISELGKAGYASTHGTTEKGGIPPGGSYLEPYDGYFGKGYVLHSPHPRTDVFGLTYREDVHMKTYFIKKDSR